jgi:hypothetical protein
MATTPGHMLVPTLVSSASVLVLYPADLLVGYRMPFFTLVYPLVTLLQDLAWHTHQLDHSRYRSDTLRLLNVSLNHDDAVEQSTLSTSYDATAKAWKASPTQLIQLRYLWFSGCIQRPI